MKKALVDVISATFGARLDYLALYPARVVQQTADGKLDLIPDDDRRLPHFQGVPIVLGVPGVTVTVLAGARVLLGFASGDPEKPQAWLWELQTAVVSELRLDAATIRFNTGSGSSIARVGDTVAPSSAWTAWFVAVGTFTGSPPPGVGAANLGAINTGANQVKA